MPLHRARFHAPLILLVAIALILPAGVGAVLTDAATARPATSADEASTTDGRNAPGDAGPSERGNRPDHAGKPDHAGPPEREEPPFLVGTGTAETNPTEQVCVGGYGSFCNRPSQGLRDDLTARALAITSAESDETFVLVTGTAVGLFAAYKPEQGPHGIYDVRRRIAEETGVPSDHVVISSDHSHAAPDTIGIWGGVDADYMAILANGLVGAAREAIATRTPALLRVAAFDATGFGYELDSSYSQDPTSDSAMDNEFRVLFADSPDGTRLATFTNYAPHATVCGDCDDHMTGDWPEWAAQEAESLFGGGGIATVGALGATDFNKPGGLEERVANAKDRLRTLLGHADEVAVPVTGDEVAVDTVFIREQLAQPVLAANLLPGIPSPAEFAENPFVDDGGEIRIDRAITPPWLTGQTIGTYGSAIRIGDVFLSTFPGEPFPQLQDALRETVSGAQAHFLIGAANDFLGYMVADEETYQQTFEEGAAFLAGCPEEAVLEGVGAEHDGACPDHWTLMVSPTIGAHLVCTIQDGAERIGFGVTSRDERCAALTATDGVGAPEEHPGGDPEVPVGATTRAGVASVDASWHLGASGGQFSEHQAPPGSRNVPGEELLDGELPDGEPEQEYVDPFLHAKRKRMAKGLQSRIVTRALVVEGVGGDRVAIVGNDLYLPNDLVNRRVAQLLEQHDLAVQAGLKDGPITGIGEDNLAVTVSHNHNSAFYSTPSWGTWIFQDVFDLRFFEYMAERMAQAVIDATADIRPVRIGAATVPFNEIQAHTIGPKIADDGTPAGQPYAHTTGMMSVVRVDDISDPRHPQPYANWITLGLHPEWTWGYDLFSGDITHAAMRVIDRELGTTTVMSQRETGSSGPHKDLRVHEPEERREFQESGWQQLDVGARLWADKVHEAWAAIENATAPAPYDPHRARTDGPPIELVPFGSDLDVDVASARFAPPWTRPVPGISNCNTASLFHGDWRVPVLGLPDCEDGANAIGQPIVDNTPFEEREVYDQLKEAGVPIPESYTATKFLGVEETAAVHLMAMRLGDIAVTFCPCEQFTDTAINIQTRLDRTPDNVWAGWDWTTQQTPSGRDFCVQNEDETWTCADPRYFREAGPWPDLPPITDLEYRRMRAQINNDAEGWEDIENAPTHLGGEAEPVDPTEIKGNYTHREIEGIDGYGAADGYAMTIAVGMANDYFGYTPSYREMRAYDHYRKALNGLGLHGSDYLATRLVKLAASLRGGDPIEMSPLDLAYQAEAGRARAVSQSMGELARAHVATYDATLPPDGGEPAITQQPQDIERFAGAVIRFIGGSTYTDLPEIRVERLVDGEWVTFADQSGEVQTEARFPTPEELPAFQAGDFAWEWTASWEAYVGQVPLPDATGALREATPPGTYRFVIDGHRRVSAGDVVEAYHLESETFQVHPWDGITVEDIRSDGETIRISVGPSSNELFDGRLWSFGSIDYPNAWLWQDAMRSVADKRSLTEKGHHGEHGERVFYRYRSGTHDDQAYCLFCRFHPWLEEGEATFAWVTIERPNGKTKRVAAVREGTELVARFSLEPDQRAYIEAGDLFDPYGNINGQRSAVITG